MQAIAQMNPQEQSLFIQMLQQAMSPQLAQMVLYPVLSRLNSLVGFPANNPNIVNDPNRLPTVPSQTEFSASEQRAYQLGYDDGYHSGTTAKPSLCMLFVPSPGSYCGLQQQFPQAYNAGFQKGLTEAVNAIHEGKAHPPIGQVGGSSSKFNPYGTFDYCPANPEIDSACEAKRSSNR